MISGETDLLAANVLSVMVVAAFSLIMTFVIIKCVNLLMPIRVTADDETRGLDQSVHGEMARHRQ